MYGRKRLKKFGHSSVHSQVFEIYESMPDPSLQHMNAVVRSAVNICSGVYITFGLFGNIAASGLDIGGSNPEIFCLVRCHWSLEDFEGLVTLVHMSI